MTKIIAQYLQVLLLSINITFGQNILPDSNPFKAGENLEYIVHYGIFNASYASLKLTNEKLDGKDFLLASGYGKTIGLARLFFKVEDYYSSYFDDTVVTPYFFKRNIYEGGYTKNLEVKFNPELQNATVNNIKNQTIETINTEKNVQDLISSLYYLRKNFSEEKVSIGDPFIINMF